MDADPPRQRACPERRVEHYPSPADLLQAILVNAWTGWRIRVASRRADDSVRAVHDR